MATIASLAVQLVADPTRAVAGLATFGRAAQQTGGKIGSVVSFANHVARDLASNLSDNDPFGAVRTGIHATTSAFQSLASRIPYVGSLLSGLGGVAGGVLEEIVNWTQRAVGLFKQGAASIASMSQAAIQLGTSTEKAAGMMMAFGGDTEVMSNQMLRFGEALTEAAQKAPGMEGVFSRFGMNARELARTDLPSAYMATVRALGQLTPALQAQAAATLIGRREGHKMLEVIAKGPEVFDRGAAAAQRFGIAVSGVDASNVKRANLALKSVDFAIQGIKQNIAVGLAPVVLELASNFEEVGVNAQKVQEWAITGAKFIAYAGAAAYEGWKALKLLWIDLQVGFKILIADMLSGWQTFFKTMARLPENMGGGIFAQLSQDLGPELTGLLGSLDTLKQSFRSQWEAMGDSFGKVDAFFDRVQQRQAAIKKAAGKGDSILPKMDMRQVELFKRVFELETEMRSPLEKFALRMQDLNELLDEGCLKWQVYARAVGKAAGELGEIRKPMMSGSAEFGSQEAYRIINQDTLNSSRQDPVARLQELMRTQLEVQKRQEQELNQIAQAVRNNRFKVWQ